MKHTFALAALALTPLALGCAGSTTPQGTEGGATATFGESSGASADASDDGEGSLDGGNDNSDESGQSETGDDGPRLDVGFQGDVPPADGCTKVDFLFVIDSSGSMSTHQDHLIGAFPEFMDAIMSTLDEAQDYQVLVTDTDQNSAEVCEWWCDAEAPFCDYECGADEAVWGECDRTFGAGVVHPLGLESSDKDCEFPDGRRYLSSGDADMIDKFACAAQIGANHTDEWQMDGLTAAVSNEINAEDGCNEGFLRDDAILVLTLITDEPDSMSAGDVESWKQSVVDAKGGNEDAIVMLGIISDRDEPNAVCTNIDGFPTPAPDMQEFVGSFPNHAKLSICEEQEGYIEFFEGVVELVADTCDAFPAG